MYLFMQSFIQATQQRHDTIFCDGVESKVERTKNNIVNCTNFEHCLHKNVQGKTE